MSEPISACGDSAQNVACDEKCPECVYKPKMDALLQDAIWEIKWNANWLRDEGYATRAKNLESAIDTLVSQIEEDAKTIKELRDSLQWYVENDDTNMDDEYNRIWIKGKERAIAAIANARVLYDER